MGIINNIKSNTLIHQKDFERWFIDKGEEEFLPLILKPFNENAYLFLKDLEETFYPNDDNDKLLFFISGSLGMLNLADIRAKTDNLRSTPIYLISNLVPVQALFVLIKKEEYTRKRVCYLLEKHGITPAQDIEVGPNKNYLKKKISKRTPIDSRLRHEVFKRDGFKCVECGASNLEKTLHCDHILPVAQGGSDELSNLQTLCSDCNLAKSDKYFKKEEGENGTAGNI